MPLAFVAAKRTEARNLRLLGEASARGIHSDVVRRELLWPEVRPMSRLLVLTTRELAAGYRLAGVARNRGRLARRDRDAGSRSCSSARTA